MLMKGTLFIQTTCLYQISFVRFSSFRDVAVQTITTASTGPRKPSTDGVAILNTHLPLAAPSVLTRLKKK